MPEDQDRGKDDNRVEHGHALGSGMRKTFHLPPDVLDRPEAQESYMTEQGGYPLRGRPFGLGLVWGNSYQSDQGGVQLMIALDR